jgi:hypothetical protein
MWTSSFVRLTLPRYMELQHDADASAGHGDDSVFKEAVAG